VAADREPTCRSSPDLPTLLVGVSALAVALLTLIGATPWGPHLDPRWVLAGGAMFVGIVLLVATVRPRGRSGDREG
jgi:uncharacterized membrane protein YbhN (UPF0104 family)